LCGRNSGLEEEPCLIPCPSDCRLSEWSAWGECSAICGPGLHNRSRQVSQSINIMGFDSDRDIYISKY